MVAFWLHNWSYGGICEDKNRTIALDLQSWLKILLRTERFERVVLYVSCCLVAKLCPTLCDPMDCSPPGSSVQGISQARILEWVVISFSRRPSWPKDQTPISCTGRGILYHWAPREALGSVSYWEKHWSLQMNLWVCLFLLSVIDFASCVLKLFC